MKNLLTGFCFIFLLSGCSIKYYPLKSQYPTPPIIDYSDKSFDKVWDNIIDFYSQNGISIKIIDRSSGLIISTQSRLTATYENKNGHLNNPNAFVVLERSSMQSEDGRKSPSFEVLGEWNIRIKSDGGRTSININIVNLTSETSTYGKTEKFDPHAHTTGVFEKLIFDKIR